MNLGTRYLGDRRCLEEGCTKLASYGDIDVRIPRYCRSHKGKKDIDVINKLCEAKGGCGCDSAVSSPDLARQSPTIGRENQKKLY